MPVSIDGKSIVTLYYSTRHKVHKSKQNFYLDHPKDLHALNITDNVDCASLALQVAPVSYYCLKKIIGLRPRLGNTYYHIMGRSPNYGRNSNILISDPYH